MKKISVMFAALLASMSIFASKEVAPTATDLANYYEAGQLCVAVYFEAEVCNDIVFIGSYNSWSEDVSTMTKFETVDGFEGWYVVAVDAIANEDGVIQGKPVQLKSDGTFSWDYQTGDADSWTLVSGTVTIEAGYSGEANLTGYDAATPVVLISAYFKNHNNPCVAAVKHNYTVNLKAPICGSDPADYSTYFAPAIIGDFNGWSEGVAMTLNEETMVYSYTFEDEEKHAFKFKAVGDTDWTNEIQLLVKNEETGEESWQGNPNITLGETEVIDLDYSAGRYTLCADAQAIENTAVKSVAVKTIENGQLVIRVNDQKINVLGTVIE